MPRFVALVPDLPNRNRKYPALANTPTPTAVPTPIPALAPVDKPPDGLAVLVLAVAATVLFGPALRVEVAVDEVAADEVAIEVLTVAEVAVDELAVDELAPVLAVVPVEEDATALLDSELSASHPPLVSVSDGDCSMEVRTGTVRGSETDDLCCISGIWARLVRAVANAIAKVCSRADTGNVACGTSELRKRDFELVADACLLARSDCEPTKGEQTHTHTALWQILETLRRTASQGCECEENAKQCR